MLRLPCLSAYPPPSCWAERTTLELNMILEHKNLEHNTLNMMRPDGHLQAEESNGAPTALSDGADFERLEDKDQVPTTEGRDTLGRDGGRDKVACLLCCQPDLHCQPILPCTA